MTKPTVYLAGPIVGCTDSEANDWRVYVAEKIAKAGVRGVSPLRCEPITGEIYPASGPDPKFGTARAIGSKNVYDVRNTDMTLAYIPTPPEGGRHSWGTMCELAGAHFINKQTILVSDDPIVLAHPVLDGMSGWVLNTLDEAIEVICGVLGGYTEEGKNV
jgi:hypothetical protein